ncbi:MAG TPA: sigma-70 family RNA polymerase sigma factor [Steroidobacteraceae bacterium]|nr:sigma-70 family RNA polymerase sigma factor [Steroidobacteraceae bacterium]
MRWRTIEEEIADPMALSVKRLPNERDNELLSCVAAGDRRALEELYLSYHRRLARYLSRFTRYENVEEIINDTFMVVWQNAKGFRSASQVSTWIIGIAYRTALKSLREQKRFSAAAGDGDFSLHKIDPTRDAETQDWLAHGLSGLPPEQRLTLELAYHMGYSLEEIAAITDSPVGTVKARMFRAREKLRRSLSTLGGGAAWTPPR